MLKSNKRITVIVFLLYFILYILLAAMIFNVTEYRESTTNATNIKEINTVSASIDGGPWETVTLPHEFKGLSPRTPVSIKASIKPNIGDYLYVKTVYSPAKIWLNDKLSYTMGSQENYPKFFSDPPTHVQIIDTHGTSQNMEFLIQYHSPVSRSSLMVHNFALGPSKDLIFNSASHLAGPMILSMVQIIVGCIMLCASIFTMLIYSNGQLFFWLGLFSKFSGIWFLCENNFSVLCFKNDSLLYILSFVGFFTFIVPLLHFIRLIIDSKNSKLLMAMEIFSAVAAITAIVLQFTGVLSFSKSMYFFHIWIPLALIIVTVVIARKTFVQHDRYAKRLLLPVGILTISALLELFNYRVHMTYIFSSLFQAGMFIFLFLICIIAGLDFKDGIELKKKETILEQEKNILNIQTEEQRVRSLLLAQNEQDLRRQRHDLRHHLTAIQELSGDNQDLQEYLATLLQHIPTSPEHYCENTVVNSIICHYAASSHRSDISLTVDLIVPETNDQTMDSNLCVIFANLLENAVEACNRMTQGQRFINIRSNLHNNMLVIVMENSYDGKCTTIDGRFRSSKRNNYGIGLSSIQSIAEEAHGNSKFTAEQNKFISSLYLQIH